MTSINNIQKAPTGSGLWPPRPSRRATAEDVERFPNVFKVGDPIAYVRDPSKWLPEFSLENMPLADVKRIQVRYDNNIAGTQTGTLQNKRNKMITETVTDTRTDDVKAPKARKAKAPKAKAPKAPREPKTAWEASPRAEEAIAIMREIAETGDKKTLAFFVAVAIECRQRGKDVRESMILEDEPAADVGAESVSDEADA